MEINFTFFQKNSACKGLMIDDRHMEEHMLPEELLQ